MSSSPFGSGPGIRSEIEECFPPDSGTFGEFEPHFDKIAALRRVAAHGEWTRCSSPPNEQCLQLAWQMLETLRAAALLPTGIAASAEGGVGIFFEQGNKYADFEVLNCGKLLGVTSDGAGMILPFEITHSVAGYSKAIERVREFLDA